jgi:transposase
VQYGERLAAAVTYLSVGQFLPEDRLGQLLADLFGITVSAGTIGQMVARAAAQAGAFAAVVREKICHAPVKHLDETGFRMAAQQQWLHVACTSGAAGLVHYRVSARRGAMLAGAAHIVVHDHWTSYFQMQGVTHAMCNTHHLRELTALVDIDAEVWAKRMRRLLRSLCHRVDLGARRAAWISAAERLYDRIIQDGIAWHEALPALPRDIKRGRIRRRTGHNLLLRLKAHREAVLLFLHNPAVPFTNNEAERDVRMMKLGLKNLGRLPHPTRRRKLRHPAHPHRHRQKARLEPARNTCSPVIRTHQRARPRIARGATWAVTAALAMTAWGQTQPTNLVPFA